jgi:DNA-binding response OmpR family regulator
MTAVRCRVSRLHQRPTEDQANLQEVIMAPVSEIRTGKLVVDLEAHVATVDERPVNLTGKEYAILELLSLRKGIALTKEMILDHLYGGVNEPEAKIIDVFVCKLRQKLALATGGKHYIETLWGRGYLLRERASPPQIKAYFGADHQAAVTSAIKSDNLRAAWSVAKNAVA